jgi:hypothetical protein
VFRRRSAGATDDTAQDSPGAQSPDGPADRKPRPASSAETTPPAPRPAEAAKGRPTPKRSVAEAKRRQPITGSRGPATPRTQEEKAKARADRVRKTEAMRRGEEWALQPRDRGPVRALARNYVDSKRRVMEYYLILFGLVLVVDIAFSKNAKVASYIQLLILAVFVVIIIDALLLRRNLRKLIAQRLPGQSTRGLTVYAVMRAMQIRRMRMPKPQVDPGDPF